MVFQDLALWPHLTVYGNLSFGLEARRMKPTERAKRIQDVLSRVGLVTKAQSYPGELSGGERQRVAIARALVVDPLAVLLDEPLSNLDLALKDELLEMFRSLLHERQVPAIYVTHDPREASALGDRIAVLDSGKIVQEGTVDTLRSAPATPFICRLLKELA
jgi:ABC-type Fe3+/spermidine/putrescine transport system ATPase subunit